MSELRSQTNKMSGNKFLTLNKEIDTADRISQREREISQSK